ncbi:MAG: FecR domain-containing protein [Myxococcota bacterium]
MKPLLAILSATLVVCSAFSASAQEKFQTYTVKKGDTCTSIAREFYGDAQAYHHIHEYNDLSEQGYACRAGTELKLPILPDQPEAKLMARAGDVRAKPPKASWDPVDVGAEIYEAWRVNTLERSRAELGFRDNSNLQMTENTLVVIYGPSRERAETRRTVSRRAKVEEGRLKTRLADLSGSRMDVETPDARVQFASGNGQVTVDDGESRIANHSGKAASVSASDGSGTVAVKSGQGTRVPQGKPPEPPRPLPPTPTWSKDFAPKALTLGGSNSTVSATWNAVSGANAYYIEVSRSRRQVDVLFSQKVPADITSLEMRNLPPGDYFVSIVSIDDDKFESIPSKLRELRILAMGVEPGDVVTADQRAVLLGATLEAPRGMKCAVGETPPAEAITLTSPGEHELTCSADGMSVSTTVEAIAPTATRVSSDDEALTVRPGALESVDVQFEPGLPQGVVAQTSDGLEANPMQVGPKTMRVNLTAPADAAEGQSRLELVYEDVVLGEFDVEIQPREKLTAAGSSSGARAEYLAFALVGYDAVDADPFWNEAVSAGGATLEVGVGTLPTRNFAGELRAGFALHSGDASAEVVSLRGQAMAGWFSAAVAPYGALGLGWQAILGGESRFSPRTAVGVMPSLGERMRLRGELGLSATPVDGVLRFLPEARIGVSLRF